MNNYEVIIAGAGIVGLASGLKILESRPGTRLLIIEKEIGPAMHQTGHNSGVIHSGIYYKPGSLKAENCIRGYSLLVEFCKREDIPFEICGKVIVATREDEIERLNDIYRRGTANRLEEVRLIDAAELRELEPHSAGIKAIHVPYTGIVDFKAVAAKYVRKIQELGGELKYKESVKRVKAKSNPLEVISVNCSLKTKVFVNCCGLQSDEVAKRTGDRIDTRIIPFRGEYYKLKPERMHLVNNLIYPVPDPFFPFLGVHFTRMIGGGVEAGPNAVLAFKKEGYTKTSFSASDVIKTFTWGGFYRIAAKYYKTGAGEFYRSFSKRAFVKALQRLLPEINENDLIAGGSGVRAQAIDRKGKPVDDFLISNNGRVINVLNAPSPAATSSLAIGETVSNLIIKNL
jgi:(S)-2-hydroxyglutarate dehydrogenase